MTFIRTIDPQKAEKPLKISGLLQIENKACFLVSPLFFANCFVNPGKSRAFPALKSADRIKMISSTFDMKAKLSIKSNWSGYNFCVSCKQVRILPDVHMGHLSGTKL